jgi:hypothetical protein
MQFLTILAFLVTTLVARKSKWQSSEMNFGLASAWKAV